MMHCILQDFLEPGDCEWGRMAHLAKQSRGSAQTTVDAKNPA